MKTTEISLETGHRKTTIDITPQVRSFCEGQGDGLLSVFVPHATAGIALFETGAGSESDVMETIDRLIPADASMWRHEHGSPGHGRDHVLPAFVSPSITVPVVAGRPQLGTWQSIVLVDTNVDNPSRRVRLTLVSG